MRFFPIFLCAFVALSLQAETKVENVKGAVVEVYKKASGDDLRIYRMDPPGHDAKKDKRSAAVFFFGGGWNGGTVTQFAPHAQYLSQRGMVVFLADYRVKSRQNTSPRECVADGKSAVRWVRVNAERLGIDPDKIVAGGGSAGGHVAATTGICDGLDDPKDENLSVSSRPQALLLFNPVYDNGEKGYGHSRVVKWFPKISPAHNHSKDDPPTIVFLGSKDSLIPVSTGEAFRDAQKELGIQSELHVYEGRPHGFFNLNKGAEDFSDTIRKTDKFLVGLGLLDGEVDEGALEAVVAAFPKPKKKAKK